MVAGSCCRSSANSNRKRVAERRNSWSGLRRTLSVKSINSRWMRSPTRWSTNRGDQVGESRSTTRWMISPAFSDHWNARSASNWISASWRCSASSVASTRPTGGPHCGSAMRRTIIRSITCWTSSSRSSSTSTRSTVAASPATRSACDGLGQPLAEPAGHLGVAQLGLHHRRRQEVLPHERSQALAELVFLALDDRGVRDRDAQRMLEQRGHGEPVRQRTHHAGLGGRADIADPGAHAAVRLRPPAGEEHDGGTDQKAQCHDFHPAQPHRRSASASGSAPANDSARDARGRPAVADGTVGSGREAAESDASAPGEALCTTTPSSAIARAS